MGSTSVRLSRVNNARCTSALLGTSEPRIIWRPGQTVMLIAFGESVYLLVRSTSLHRSDVFSAFRSCTKSTGGMFL